VPVALPLIRLNALLALHTVPAVPESLSRRKTSLFLLFSLEEEGRRRRGILGVLQDAQGQFVTEG
jgi:hypothetical protein